MKKLIVLFGAILIVCGGILVAFAPDTLSLVIVGIMCAIILGGLLGGISPVLQYAEGFRTGRKNIERAMEVQTSTVWLAVLQIERFFRQKTMDGILTQYEEKVQRQRASQQILDDIEDYLNEDILAYRSWQGVMLQISGTMTGLGILGTFIGLVTGISGISVSTVNATLVSVQNLISGIRLAFYTSIAGVIFSILFNILYKMSWNIMVREMGVFIDAFHKNVIPSAEEQARHRERREVQQILERLDRIPRNPGYSVANPASQTPAAVPGNEQILMPQIMNGLKSGEFTFYLQPRYELNSSKVIGAEALVRWNHAKLGVVSPAVFVPILENNGYIAKLDQYIWELVCQTIRRWIDAGLRPVAISVNVTKTDILAMDVAGCFEELAGKYRIPPRYLDIEIAENAYLQSGDMTRELEGALREKGFRVVLDGFDGNFVALGMMEDIHADAVKLDIRRLDDGKKARAIDSIFEQARKFQCAVSAEGIENMEQLTALRRGGCTEGQGYYFSKPISLEEFERMLKGMKDHEKKPKERGWWH